jgi:hypothetical protein
MGALTRRPWPTGTPFGGFHSHMPYFPWDEPDRRGGLWPYDFYGEERCCELCDAWDAIVGSASHLL